MGNEGTLRVAWSRGELSTIRDAIEVTPNFEGRVAVRDVLRNAMRPGASPYVELEHEAAVRFAARLVAADLATAMAKTRLLRAIRDAEARRLVHGGDPGHRAHAA
jgi:shikimate 5-dehydrogenase